jgi:hypothetical protein
LTNTSIRVKKTIRKKTTKNSLPMATIKNTELATEKVSKVFVYYYASEVCRSFV